MSQQRKARSVRTIKSTPTQQAAAQSEGEEAKSSGRKPAKRQPLRPAAGEAQARNGEKRSPKRVGLSLNWKRAIYINRPIDDALLRELAPLILQMKQENSEPITVGIDSPGGSLAAAEAILSLLRSPDQDGNRTEIYTAAINRAYSAAASLLAFGDYSVAFPHSRILYHDVRYSGLEDVTPSKALQTARELEKGNAVFSLRLANHICRRLLWVYLDLRPNFPDIRNRYTTYAKRYDEAFKEILPQGTDQIVDVVGFSLTLFRKLSSPADNELAIRALQLLNSWMQIEKIEQRLSKSPTEKKSLDVVKGINELVAEIRGMEVQDDTSALPAEPSSDFSLDDAACKDITLLFEVLARRFAADKNLSMNEDGLDVIMEEFSFIKDINSTQHLHTITKMMIDHDYMFFGRSISDEIKNAKDNDERRRILAPVYPQARMLWYYIVLICRCLCRGEHFLTPSDAQLLGLVDEVLGGGPVEGKREWRKANPEYEQLGSI